MSCDNTIVTEYIKHHACFSDKYGKEKTIVLMQVGSFYEAYATDEVGPDLKYLESLTDVVVTRRNTKNDVSIKNPYLWGFPMVSISKYIEILISDGFHVVTIDQFTDASNVISRKISAVYSPGTYTENISIPSSNYIVSLFIEYLPQKNNDSLLVIGMSAIDCSTGSVLVHEAYSHNRDTNFALDEASRFIVSINPNEIVLFATQKNQQIIDHLNIHGKLYQLKEINKEHCKVAFQKKLFETIYNDHNTFTNIFDVIDLTSEIYARNSLSSLLMYIADHKDTLISGISLPKFSLNNQHVVLGNNAVNQLNILSINVEKKCKLNSNNFMTVNDIVNKASTPFGHRFIVHRLASPLTNCKELESIYKTVDSFLKDNYYKTIDENLKHVRDIERFYRNIKLRSLHPMYLVELMDSFIYIEKIYKLLETKKKFNKKTSLLLPKINEFNKTLESTIKINSAKLYKINDIRTNIFNFGYCHELDDLEKQISTGESTINMLLSKLNEIITTNSNNSNNLQNAIILKHNKRDGYYLQTTKKRFILLNDELKKIKILKISATTNININELKIDTSTKIVKITAPFLKNHTNDIELLTKKIIEIAYKNYVKLLTSIEVDFGNLIEKSIELVTHVDYITTIAKVSLTNNYIRPNICKIATGDSFSTPGYIKAIELRHPIVEKIIDHEYVPHDILIDNDTKGILLYGLNSSGKSVLMKAIGISLIMAQAGFFVPAKEYTFYPYKAIYTRITGNDNIYRGMSSFTLEMNELNAILKRANSDTLIIGDEVCRGTEHISGNAIVAASLLKLLDVNASFIFATHLHELTELDEIKNKTKIKSFHLLVENKNGLLVFDRKLREGSGDKIYGITVAKHIIQNLDVINKALEIKNILLDKNPLSSGLATKYSKYNSNVLMDKCGICGKLNTHIDPSPLESHHINKQSDSINGFDKTKKHIPKNAVFNLLVVCRKCHDKIHNQSINIIGYKMTSNGNKLITE